ncbi:MAG: thiamine diphosphokinase [Firmicutes bacterium]|nr:thiamine diphosphokinase [Bacillota bacterium]MDD4263133.1 thiamine diphosphokinase [Bacillota bacterium]MDD4694182.1 thiamine diphosphokinase [Bacillota bacterium]
MHVLLLGSSPETLDWHEGPQGSWDKIICADGGLNLAYKWNLEPDWVLGDGDSYQKPYPLELKQETYPEKKDATDSELATTKAIDLGATEITLVGFLGARLDHTLANLFHVASLEDVFCTFYEEWGKAFFARKTNEIFGEKGDLLSLIPIKGDVEGVRTEGLEYPLFDETLYLSRTRGISNVFLEDRCVVTIKKGSLLIVHLRNEIE